MNETKIENMIDEKLGARVAHHFGVMQEWFTDQFTLVHEKFEMLEEKMDRGFAEIREDLDRVKRNTDTNSLEILTLQEKQKRADTSIKKLNQVTKLLEKRVGKLEKKHEYV